MMHPNQKVLFSIRSLSILLTMVLQFSPVLGVVLALPVGAEPKNCARLLGSKDSTKALVSNLSLRKEFEGEENGVWVPTSTGIFGRNVRAKQVYVKTRYLTSDELPEVLATVEDGRLVSNFPQAMDLIFVVMPDGELRVYPKNLNESSFGRMKHSSLAQGQDVLMAGEISLYSDGRIYAINNHSGHCLPPLENLN